jgi:hypothetical protein
MKRRAAVPSQPQGGEMRKAIIPALLLVLVSVVLGATVFREQVAHAASNLNVFVTNDAAHPVPVREQGTVGITSADQNVVLYDHTNTPTDGNFTPLIDTANAKEIRIFASALDSDGQICVEYMDANGAFLGQADCSVGSTVLIKLPPPKIKIVAGIGRYFVIARKN